jgi:hypothetical protein
MANRVQFLICVLVLTARASLATGTNDGMVLSRGQSLAWIRTSADKTHFVCDGTDQRFVPWGFNYDHDDAGRFLEYYWADDWAKVTNDFREMKILGANVVRVSPQLCCLMKSPEQPDETNLARLGMLVRLAEANGLYLDVTGLGYYHKDEVPAYDAMDESARWKVQARYWRAVAEVCKDSPAIFCYDLMNEPVPSGDRKGDWLPGQPMGDCYFVQRLRPARPCRGRTRPGWRHVQWRYHLGQIQPNPGQQCRRGAKNCVCGRDPKRCGRWMLWNLSGKLGEQHLVEHSWLPARQQKSLPVHLCRRPRRGLEMARKRGHCR